MHLHSATPIVHKEEATAIGDSCIMQLHRDCSEMCAHWTVCVCFITAWWNLYWRSVSRHFIWKHKYHRYNEAMVFRAQDACLNTHTSNISSSVNSCCFFLQCVGKMPGWHKSSFLPLMAVLMCYRKCYENRHLLYDTIRHSTCLCGKYIVLPVGKESLYCVSRSEFNKNDVVECIQKV
jgi:hypothetical protein